MDTSPGFQLPLYGWVLAATAFCWMFIAFNLILLRPGPLGEAENENTTGIWRVKLFVLSYFGSFVLTLPTLFIFPTLFKSFLLAESTDGTPILEDIVMLMPSIAIFLCGSFGCLFAITVVRPREFENPIHRDN